MIGSLQVLNHTSAVVILEILELQPLVVAKYIGADDIEDTDLGDIES